MPSKPIIVRFDGGQLSSEARFQPSAQTASYAASFVTASSLLVLLSPVPAPRFGHFPVPPPPGE